MTAPCACPPLLVDLCAPHDPAFEPLRIRRITRGPHTVLSTKVPGQSCSPASKNPATSGIDSSSPSSGQFPPPAIKPSCWPRPDEIRMRIPRSRLLYDSLSTSTSARCTNLSTSAAMPHGRSRPSAWRFTYASISLPDTRLVKASMQVTILTQSCHSPFIVTPSTPGAAPVEPEVCALNTSIVTWCSKR